MLYYISQVKLGRIMKIGDLVRVKTEWEFCYPKYKGVLGIITEIIQLRNNRRIWWLHPHVRGVERTSMPQDTLEVIR
jgi:hypothetical protein